MARKINYEAYVRAYNKQKAKLEKRGFQMDKQLLRKWEYEAAYREFHRDLYIDYMEGNRKGVGSVIQYIVRTQAYKTTSKQGSKLNKAAQQVITTRLEEAKAAAQKNKEPFDEKKWLKENKVPTRMQIRTGNFDFTLLSDISKRRKAELMAIAKQMNGGRELTLEERKKINKQVRLEISHEFFGSP